MVSILDFFPDKIVSNYCYYDVDYKFLNLGKYSAMFEIYFARLASKPYYYMGSYVRGVTKVMYKIDYKPSFLQCPTIDGNYEFLPSKIALESFDENNRFVIHENSRILELKTDFSIEMILDHLHIWIGNKIMEDVIWQDKAVSLRTYLSRRQLELDTENSEDYDKEVELIKRFVNFLRFEDLKSIAIIKIIK